MKNKFTDAFIKRTFRMIESPAYRVLSLAAYRVLSRIEIELGRHGGKDNGKLPVTTEDFIEYGMDRHTIAPAIRELEDLGLIQVIRGYAGKAGQYRPSLYRLTYLPSFGEDPSNEWASILTIEDAQKIAKAARARKATRKSGFRWGKTEWGKIPFSDGENPHRHDGENPHQDRWGKPPSRNEISDGGKQGYYLDIYPSSEREIQPAEDLAQGTEPGSKQSGGSE
jgi:hypothetical protein